MVNGAGSVFLERKVADSACWVIPALGERALPGEKCAALPTVV